MGISQEAVEYYNSGNEWLRRRDYKRAVEELEKAKESDPDSGEVKDLLGQAYCSLGTYYYNRGMYNRVINVLEKCLTTIDYDDAHYILACAYEKVGDYEKSVGEYRKAIEVDPEDGWNRKALGDVYLKVGEYDQASDEYKRADELYPDGYAEAHHNLLAVHVHQGHYEEAISEYGEFIERNPHSARAHNNLGLIYAKKGDRAQAEEEYSRAIKLKNDYADPHYNLGILHFREEGYPQAATEFEKVLEIDSGHIKARLGLALSLEKGDEIEKALKHYRSYIRSFRKPDDKTKNRINRIKEKIKSLEESLSK